MEEKQKSPAGAVIIAFLIIITATCGLFNYKEEILTCKIDSDVCQIQRTNLFNMPSVKKIAKYSQVARASWYRQKIKGNRYSKGYKEFILILELRNNNNVKLFSKTYYEKNEIDSAIKEINYNLAQKKDFNYKR